MSATITQEFIASTWYGTENFLNHLKASTSRALEFLDNAKKIGLIHTVYTVEMTDDLHPELWPDLSEEPHRATPGIRITVSVSDDREFAQ